MAASNLASQAPSPVTPEPDEDEAVPRGFDAEILTMNRVLKLLGKLDEPARSRVMSYLHARHQTNA